jgi:hypothetical protein
MVLGGEAPLHLAHILFFSSHMVPLAEIINILNPKLKLISNFKNMLCDSAVLSWCSYTFEVIAVDSSPINRFVPTATLVSA